LAQGYTLIVAHRGWLERGRRWTLAKHILITGATGFFGRHLVPCLVGHGYFVRATTRRPVNLGETVEVHPVGDLTENIDWVRHIDGMDAIIHLAGLAHLNSGTTETEYDTINRGATVRLAKAASAVGARFIFMSSIAAQTGPSTKQILTEDDPPLPTTAYGRSKLQAEQEIAAVTNEYVVFRPTLTYGYGVKGNMERIINLATLRFAPPFGSIRNLRSLLAVENMCEAVNFALNSHAALKQIFILSDPEPISMAEIIILLRSGSGLNGGGLRVPPVLLSTALRLLGRHEIWQKIGENLVTSVAKLERFGFQWRTSSSDALRRLGTQYASRSSARVPFESTAAPISTHKPTL
jgi:nucleoside-diphosphate-sugar epimerase